MSKKQRNLDGIYFRVKRDGKWCNVCYSDMEQAERDEVARKRAETSTPAEQEQWWRSMADTLADQLCDIEKFERDENARKIAKYATLEEQVTLWRSIADRRADQLYELGERLGVVCE